MSLQRHVPSMMNITHEYHFHWILLKSSCPLMSLNRIVSFYMYFCLSSLQDSGHEKCLYCQKLIRKPYMSSHLTHFHSDAPLKLRCPVCHLVFPRKWNFDRHLLTHTKLKVGSCCCNKRFVSSGRHRVLRACLLAVCVTIRIYVPRQFEIL